MNRADVVRVVRRANALRRVADRMERHGKHAPRFVRWARVEADDAFHAAVRACDTRPERIGFFLPRCARVPSDGRGRHTRSGMRLGSSGWVLA